MKLNIDFLNALLKQNNQLSVITYYSANPKKVIVNNKEYEGNLALRIIRRLNGDKLWVANFDRIYLLFEDDAEQKIRSLISVKGGKSCQDKHGDKIKKNLNTGNPWNKDLKGNYPYSSWCKGLTKATNKQLSNLSENRKGSGNPMFGTVMSDVNKEKKSKLMKEKILDGSFTPKSNNRNTHWDIRFEDKKFRSSWEAIYYSTHRDDLHEELRIPYNFNNKDHIYIVDFINHETKIVTEIKPKELLLKEKNVSKINALNKWASENNFTVNIITQDNIADSIDITLLCLFDEKTQKKIKILYETYIEKRNR